TKKPAPPEVAKTTPTPGPEVKTSTSLGPQSDRVAPPRMGGEGVILVAPIPYFKPRPDYPKNAMKNGLKGSVVVRVVVSATGAIIEAKVSQSSGSVMLDEAARRGVLMWKFHPGRQASGNVTTAVDVPIDFTLPNLNANGGEYVK
ncbi:MAG: energy transducer TonB, partial [Alphaproteobacteria bacterium]|nr:energy transducer TonB [Alphaproteobacteria bacterium]